MVPKAVMDMACTVIIVYMLWCIHQLQTLCLGLGLCMMLLYHLYRYGQESGVDDVSENHRFDFLYQEMRNFFDQLEAELVRICGALISNRNNASPPSVSLSKAKGATSLHNPGCKPECGKPAHPPLAVDGSVQQPSAENDDEESERKIVISTMEATADSSSQSSFSEDDVSHKPLPEDELDEDHMSDHMVIENPVNKCFAKTKHPSAELTEMESSDDGKSSASLDTDEKDHKPHSEVSQISSKAKCKNMLQNNTTDKYQVTGTEEIYSSSTSLNSSGMENIINPEPSNGSDDQGSNETSPECFTKEVGESSDGAKCIESDEESKAAELDIEEKDEGSSSASSSPNSRCLCEDQTPDSPSATSKTLTEEDKHAHIDDIPLGKRAMKVEKGSQSSKTTEADIKPSNGIVPILSPLTGATTTVSLATQMENGSKVENIGDLGSGKIDEEADKGSTISKNKESSTEVFSPENDPEKITASSVQLSQSTATLSISRIKNSSSLEHDSQLCLNGQNANLHNAVPPSEDKQLAAAVAKNTDLSGGYAKKCPPGPNSKKRCIDLSKSESEMAQADKSIKCSVSLSLDKGLPDLSSNNSSSEEGNEDMAFNLQEGQSNVQQGTRTEGLNKGSLTLSFTPRQLLNQDVPEGSSTICPPEEGSEEMGIILPDGENETDDQTERFSEASANPSSAQAEDQTMDDQTTGHFNNCEPWRPVSKEYSVEEDDDESQVKGDNSTTED